MRDLTPKELRMVRTPEQNAASDAFWKNFQDMLMPSPPGHVSRELIAEARRAIEDGNEDCIGLERLIPNPPICEAISPARVFSEEHRCPYIAKFKTKDGKRFCQIHAERWAAENNNP